MRFKDIWTMLKRVFHQYSEDKVPRLAAALSYYTVFALAPLIIITIAVAGFILGNNAAIRSQVMGQVQGVLGAKAAQTIGSMVSSRSTFSGGIIATIIGAITILFGATGIFAQLQESLNTIWDVTPKKNQGFSLILKDRLLSFLLVLGLSLLVLIAVVASAGLAVINNSFTQLLGGFAWIVTVMNYIIWIGIMTLVFAALFKVLPDVEIAWDDVWTGAGVTAVLFVIGQFLLSLYLGRGSVTSAYGAAGSLIIILIWVYYSSQILFVGAEFTQVYSAMEGKQIEPSPVARRVTQEERANRGEGVEKSGPKPGHQGQRQAGRQTGNLEGALIPVAGQPAIHAEPGGEISGGRIIRREKVRYEPRNPDTVIPVIAAGALAVVAAIGRVVWSIFE